jgi:SM-20-related protein
MTKNPVTLSEKRIDKIADVIAQHGFILLQDFLPNALAEALLREAQTLSISQFKPAGIGRNSGLQLNTQVRSDSTLWLNIDSPCQAKYLEFMQQLKEGLNRRLFMGLFDFECHFSHYQKGDFYQKHIDAFKGRSNRILSTVYYLNHDWIKGDGGELALYAQNELQASPVEMVPPLFNQCVIFLSDTFPHEVLESQKDRYSIAGWYRVNGSSMNQIDPVS